jgi:hypothetical protein
LAEVFDALGRASDAVLISADHHARVKAIAARLEAQYCQLIEKPEYHAGGFSGKECAANAKLNLTWRNLKQARLDVDNARVKHLQAQRKLEGAEATLRWLSKKSQK